MYQNLFGDQAGPYLLIAFPNSLAGFSGEERGGKGGERTENGRREGKGEGEWKGEERGVKKREWRERAPNIVAKFIPLPVIGCISCC